MTKLIVSTVRRNIPATEPSGYLYSIDLENQQTLRRTKIIEPTYRKWDNNPRGGLRGCRGISVLPNQIAIANATHIYRFDPQWTFLGETSHPACSAIHDILIVKDSFWISSARNDLCVHMDFSGKIIEYINLREKSNTIHGLNWRPPHVITADMIEKNKIDFRDPRTNEEEKFDWAHVNSVCFLENGDMLISLGLILNTKYAAFLRIKSQLYKAGYWQAILSINRKIRNLFRMRKDMHSDLIVHPAYGKSAVIRLTPQGEISLSLIIEQMTTPSHSLLPLKDGSAIYLNTTEGKVIHFNPLGKNHVLSTTKVTDGFLRGVTLLPNGDLIMGSRGELIIFNLSSLKILSSIRITPDPNESVYDIKILPEHFSLPPYTLDEKIRDQFSN